MAKKISKKSDFQFHLDNISSLKDHTDFLKKIKNFNMDDCYSRENTRGWWMATKQILIRKYIRLYLNVFNAQKKIPTLIFIDLLSSNGMNKVTKEGGKDNFIFPGASISAALISQKYKIGFSRFYCNDRSPDNRKILARRFDALNNSNKIKKKIKYSIDLSEEKIDSNKWIIKVIDEINKKYSFKNCLIVIDNEGMNILFDVIKYIKEKLFFADLIINLQSQAIGRNIQSERAKKFFCRDPPSNLKREDILGFYKKCLEKINYQIEEIKVSGRIYYYYLLFCCRETVRAEWLQMIRNYRERRFQHWHDGHVQLFWDIVKKKTQIMDDYF
ncbi:MAG: hypothetical protein ACP6IY_11090 [Promethearchaeia archaeon]